MIRYGVMKKFFRGLGNTIFTLIIILMVIGLVGNLSAKSDKVYNIVKYRTYIIVSPSMKPAINPGDLIFVRKVDVDKIKEGDIITFKNEDMVATHRAIKIDKNTITTKGDSNNVEDYPIDKKEVIGELNPGDTITSRREIAQILKVNQNTVQKI